MIRNFAMQNRCQQNRARQAQQDQCLGPEIGIENSEMATTPVNDKMSAAKHGIPLKN
jgi:hypothetical protein